MTNNGTNINLLRRHKYTPKGFNQDTEYARRYGNMLWQMPFSDGLDDIFADNLCHHNELWEQYLSQMQEFLNFLMDATFDLEINFEYHNNTDPRFDMSDDKRTVDQTTTLIIKDAVNPDIIPQLLTDSDAFCQTDLCHYNHQFFIGVSLSFFNTDQYNPQNAAYLRIFSDWCAYHADNIKFTWVSYVKSHLYKENVPKRPLFNPDKLTTLWLS